MDREYQDPYLQKISSGQIRRCHYMGYLLETYFHAGLNPQLQAFATMYFDGNPREIVKKFFGHAMSEIGHDLIALEDLLALGAPKEFIQKQKPLASTEAYFAHAAYNIQFKSPLTYLGYLFHLEFAPTQNGRKYIQMLHSIGIPESATKFLEEHATVDIAHNKLMADYIKHFIKNENDLEIVIDATEKSVTLHSKMVSDALKNGELIFE